MTDTGPDGLNDSDRYALAGELIDYASQYSDGIPDRTGRLVRDTDPTGVSGEGVVADVWLWEATCDDTGPEVLIVVRWRGPKSSTVIWSSLEDLLAVHGHDGLTCIVWDEIPDAEIVESARPGGAA